MLKEVEIILRTKADEEKLNELIADGWKILNRGLAMFPDESDRIFVQLYKEVEEDR